MPAITGFASIFQKRSSRSQRLNRNGTECGCFSTSVSSTTAVAVPEPTVAVRLAVARVDDRVGQLVRLGLAPALEVVVERLAELLDLRVVEHADREQEALLVVGRDLLGGQRIVRTSLTARFSSSSGSGT